jgi:carbon-monoxide dehydrogenase medium subunit
MRSVAFQYHAPRSLDEALAILAEVAPEDGRIIAGGQSLVPTMAFRFVRPGHLVDINRVAGLDRLSEQPLAAPGIASGTAPARELVIGALVRHAAFHRPVVAGPLGLLLTEVASHIAHYPIRMRGTFCGSLAHADPASEWCLVASTLDARLVLRSARGERILPADEFFTGVMSTAIESDEMLVEARITLPSAGARMGFDEFSRRRGDFALAMALASFDLVDGRMRSPRVGVSGVEDRPRRIREAEALLEGCVPTTDVFQSAARAAAAAVDPLEQPQLPAIYRRELVESSVRRALERAWG